MAAYVWKTKGLFKTDANKAGQVFEELENTIGLTAENIVEVSREEDAPLHNEFEWNDTAAADKWRMEQARRMIGNLSIVVAETEEEEIVPVRAFFSTELHHYENIKTIMTDVSKKLTLMQKAVRELQAFKKKYAMLSELSKLFDAIDEVTKEVS